MAISMFLGNLLTVPTMRRGRRLAHQLVSLLHITCWITISLAPNYEVLVVGRVIQGIGFGLFMSISAIVLGEYTSPKYRGAFLAILSFCQALGICLVHVIGSFISWQHTALVFSFFLFYSLIINIYLPESPSWLAVEGRYADCRQAFRWLRGFDEEEELRKMIETEQQLNITKNRTALTQTISLWSHTLRTLGKREVYISLVLGSLMYTMAIVSGAVTLASYTNDILPVIIGKDCKMPVWMAFCDGVRLGSNGIGLLVAGRLRRRPLLYSSGTLCVIAYLAQAGYVYAKAKGFMQETLWLPIVLLTFHITTIGIGTVLVPMVIIGEIYPLQYRSICSCITNVYLVMCMFTVLKTFPGMKASIGLEGVYLVYAVVVAIVLVVSWFLLPETRGRTLQEIEEELRCKPIMAPEDIKELKLLKSSELKEIA